MSGHTAPDHAGPAGTGHAAPDQAGPAGTGHAAPDQAGPVEVDVVDLIEDVSIDGMCGVY